MIRDALRNSAGHRHGEDVGVAVVLARERERIAVGRERDERLDALPAGEPVGDAAVAADGPEVARVGEDDLRLVHRRLLQKMDARREGARRHSQRDQELHRLLLPGNSDSDERRRTQIERNESLIAGVH